MTLREIKNDIIAIKRHTQQAIQWGYVPYGNANTEKAVREQTRAWKIEDKYRGMIDNHGGYPEGNEIVDFLRFFVAMYKKIENHPHD